MSTRGVCPYTHSKDENLSKNFDKHEAILVVCAQRKF